MSVISIFKNHRLIDISYNRNKLILRHENGIYLYSSKILKLLLRVQWIFVTFSAFLWHQIFYGHMLICLNVEGYMFRERLVSPDLSSSHDTRR